MKKNVILVIALTTGTITFGQVGINTPDPKTTMDVNAKRDPSGNITDNAQLIGLQAPRVTRAELTANTAAYNADQKGALVYITDISGGTAMDQRINIDAIGYYYFDGALWQKISHGATVTEPWNVQGTADLATSNTQDIYQKGSVAIGKDIAVAPLDVKGAIRAGQRPVTETVGANSFAAGNNTVASKNNSFAFGINSKADGENSVVFGNTNTVSGAGSYILGNNNETDTQRSFIWGSSNIVSDKSHGSIVLGEDQVVKTSGSAFYELGGFVIGKSIALGYKNTISDSKGITIGSYNRTTGNGTGAIGFLNVINGGLSYALGLSNKIDKGNAFAIGGHNNISGTGGIGIGLLNNSTGEHSMTMGRKNTQNSGTSYILGQHNISEAFGETILGIANAITENKGEKDLSTIKDNSPLFQLGNGTLEIATSGADVPTQRSNAITVLRNGSTGIGIQGLNDNAKPTQMLDIGSGNVRIRQINANAGTSSDNVVVADANGILKSVSASVFKGITSEVDGVIGNEILNATANGGLVRAGAGTTASPYTLGLLNGTVNGQVMMWNDGAWNPANITNIYNSNGTLTSGRTVSQNGNNLIFTNIQKTSILNNAGAGITQDSGTGKRASIGLSNGGNNQLWLFTDTNGAAQLMATGRSTSLQITTDTTATSSSISFNTSSGNGASANQRAEIDGNGKFNIVNTLSVGYPSQQTFTGNQKLKVSGSIVTATATYPDYVFEDYLTGASKLNSDYKFKSIYDIEKFIVENKHLPGVTPVSALEKTEEGYSYNLTDLSVQSLEKIEELYLHIIQQQKLIDSQKLQLEKLLKVTENLQSEVHLLKTHTTN